MSWWSTPFKMDQRLNNIHAGVLLFYNLGHRPETRFDVNFIFLSIDKQIRKFYSKQWRPLGWDGHYCLILGFRSWRRLDCSRGTHTDNTLLQVCKRIVKRWFMLMVSIFLWVDINQWNGSDRNDLITGTRGCQVGNLCQNVAQSVLEVRSLLFWFRDEVNKRCTPVGLQDLKSSLFFWFLIRFSRLTEDLFDGLKVGLFGVFLLQRNR